jgi:DNA helicase II / ATP-dependent DNA helicase PcrA
VKARYSSAQLQEALGGVSPTPEQAAAIESASLNSHSLVIAGAGSGKTQLMSARAIYLVANGFCLPNQVLGLTFTRRAASELNQRIVAALNQLRETQYWPEDLDFDFSPPTITTYNSFADQLFRQSALTIGYDPDATLLTDASAFQLALEVTNSPSPAVAVALREVDQQPATIAGQILKLSQELVENDLSPAEADRYLAALTANFAELPQTAKGGLGLRAYTQGFIDSINHNRLLLKLAAEFQQAKRASNQIDFADQVALASKIQPERFDLNYRFILLDEYQDTSPMQAKLLAQLFRARSVMAVGDTNQAIYGWRGAGSDSLAKFFDHFGGSPEVFTLSTSWRCSKAVLDVANRFAADLVTASLPSLKLAPAEAAVQGSVSVSMFDSVAEESEALADWLAARVAANTTQAVLLRGRALMHHYAEALTRRGLTVEVSGLGGLTQTPEVLDLVCALRVVAEPESGASLMRLLAGARWGISPRDLAQLAKFAQLLTRIRPEANSTNPVTIIEALDELPRTKTETQLSEVALERMKEAAQFFAQLRRQSGLRLSEFVRLVAQDLNLDIELLARNRSLANLEAFFELVADYEATSLRPTLTSFLQWLEFAEDRERLEPPRTERKAGVVQILTAHSAKGLEWQYVAVPNLTAGEFPMRSREPKGWLSAGRVPGELRADAALIPQWNTKVADQQQLNREFDDFKTRLADYRELEERRLVYVAATRAEADLWLSGAFWKPSAAKPREASKFLQEAAELLGVELAPASVSETNPFQQQVTTASWPKPFDGSELKASAAAVLSAKPEQLAELTLLMNERELRLTRSSPQLPSRLSASALTQLITNPIEFAENLLRPLPSGTTAASSLGTEFHAALEFGLQPDESLEAALAIFSEQRPESDLARRFLDSEFAAASPMLSEQSIEFTLADFVVACKLDAVYKDFDSERPGYRIIDWKTGANSTESHLLQLSLYRLALGEWLGVGPEQITASLFYVADSKLVTPDRLLGRADLEQKIAAAKTALQGHYRF